MGVFVTLTTEKWAMREVKDGRKFGGWVWFWREISVAGNICCLTRKRNRSAEHLACILGASLEHRWSIVGAYREHRLYNGRLVEKVGGDFACYGGLSGAGGVSALFVDVVEVDEVGAVVVGYGHDGFGYVVAEFGVDDGEDFGVGL